MNALARARASLGGVAMALLVVYVVWGSTYLAIRYAIETLPTFSMAGMRYLVAGMILYGWARLRGAPRPALRHWGPSLVIGVLLLLGGNGGVVWAEHRIPSGVAALLVAVEPVWIALLAPFIQGVRRSGARIFGGLAAGLAGVAVLVIDPHGGLDPTSVDPRGALVVVLAAMSWAAGSLYATRAELPASPALATSLQMLTGGATLLLFGALQGELAAFSPHEVSRRSLLAFAYLVVLGSIVAFTAYTYLLRHARPIVASTYAFVNPVVAVLLGWSLAGEPLTWRVAAAGVLILAALGLIFSDRVPASGES